MHRILIRDLVRCVLDVAVPRDLPILGWTAAKWDSLPLLPVPDMGTLGFDGGDRGE